MRRFLLEHLVGERNLSVNTATQLSGYVDDATATHRRTHPQTAGQVTGSGYLFRRCPLLPAAYRNRSEEPPQALAINVLLRCMRWRGSSPDTVRNTSRGPEKSELSPSRKRPGPLVGYLEKPEVEAILAAPRRSTEQGRRDYAVLLFLYNSGVRASELADLTIADLTPSTGSTAASVRIHGKGGKMRQCPIWPRTSSELVRLIDGRRSTERVFLNRRNEPITRYGIHALVERNVVRAAKHLPTLSSKRISPHTFRHTTATHLLRSGVDINTIRSWLGHVSLDTTQIYAEVDLEMKAKALAKCDTLPTASNRKWLDKGLMAFLRSL